MTTEDTTEPSAEDLAVALYHALLTLHPVYGSTAGPRGGIGGQAITAHCSVNYPHSDKAQELLLSVENTLRDFQLAAARNGTDRAFFARIKETGVSA